MRKRVFLLLFGGLTLAMIVALAGAVEKNAEAIEFAVYTRNIQERETPLSAANAMNPRNAAVGEIRLMAEVKPITNAISASISIRNHPCFSTINAAWFAAR